MTINIKLDTQSIMCAILKLYDARRNMKEGLSETVEILVNEGALKAQSAYGEYPVIAKPDADWMKGEITVYGDMPMIAEFGAGDATLSGGFENTPEEARRGSYSEQHARQYSRWGYWEFGGERYEEIPPRHGLLDAKQYIIEKSTETAREVIKLD